MTKVKTKEQILAEFDNDIECFDKLSKYYNSINIFNILRIANAEIRHSNMLAWLLNPNAQHGLHDYLIKEILKYLGNDCKENLNESIIFREEHNIDILFCNNKEKIVVVFENKINSVESNNQLAKYRSWIEKKYPNYKKYYIFLARENVTPSDEENWQMLSWNIIKNILEQAQEQKLFNENVLVYINDYIETIRRYFMEDEKLQKLCDEIYNKHKDAIDLILNNKSDYTTNIVLYLKQKLQSFVSNDKKYKLIVNNKKSNYFVQFWPSILYESGLNMGVDDNHKQNTLVYFNIEIDSTKKGIADRGIYLVLEICKAKDGYQDLREKIINVARSSDLFQVQSKPSQQDKIGLWRRIDKKKWLVKSLNKEIEIAKEEGQTLEERLDKVLWPELRKYITNDIPKKTEVIVKTIKEWKK